MKLNKEDLALLCETAKVAAKAAGEYIQSQFDQQYEKKSKAGGDSLASQVVTAVDFKAQEIILEHLEPTCKQFDLGLLTEEATDDQSRLEKDYFWCIDPMDGTLPFTERRSGYSVSIALIANEGKAVVGVVYIPDLAQCFSAFTDSGVFLNNQPLLLSDSERPDVHFFMDRSFQSESFYDEVVKDLNQFASATTGGKVIIHSDWGGVRNAIGVMNTGLACYFKFTKPTKGCGSIWDYAATSIFFSELSFPASNVTGDFLHLNQPKTTFMNDYGILYASDQKLHAFIKSLSVKYNH